VDPKDLIGPGGVPVTIALVEVVKRVLPDLDVRWIPIAAILVSIAWQVGAGSVYGQDPRLGVLYGIVGALVAMGAWSGVKAMAGR
jgi:hypothetical protein